MATPTKAQFLSDVQTLLKKRYKPKAERAAGRLSILEAVVYGICHEGMSREEAGRALSRFKDDYFDWNEVRVSTLDEIQQTLAGFPQAEERARRIRRFLRQLFEKTYGFNLDPLVKKPLKDALKTLQEYEAFSSDFVTATVIQQALGGHAIPIDADSKRALGRLGITEEDPAALRSAIERAVPKNRGVEFLDLIEDLAHDVCVEGTPDCPHCELRKICPYALTHKASPASGSGSKAARSSKETDAGDGTGAPSADGAAPPSPKSASAAKADAATPPLPRVSKGKSGGKA
jgi:endonuclease-3